MKIRALIRQDFFGAKDTCKTQLLKAQPVTGQQLQGLVCFVAIQLPFDDVNLTSCFDVDAFRHIVQYFSVCLRYDSPGRLLNFPSLLTHIARVSSFVSRENRAYAFALSSDPWCGAVMIDRVPQFIFASKARFESAEKITFAWSSVEGDWYTRLKVLDTLRAR
jgi:hypothetical protein